jgi:hypothetical protein
MRVSTIAGLGSVALTLLAGLSPTALGAPGPLSGAWIGQDGRDYAGPYPKLEPNQIQDIHIALRGLPADRGVASIRIRGHGGEEWHYNGPPGSWSGHLARTPGATTADLYFEPLRVEKGREFELLVKLDDGRESPIIVKGGKADPNLRMPDATVKVRWVGQDKQDWAGPGPSVGPDGLQDVHLALSQLSPKTDIKSAAIEGPGLPGWEYGLNPKGRINAELVRRADDPSKADVYFQPDRDLKGKPLTVKLAYGNDKTDQATLTGVGCDPALRMPKPPEIPLAEAKIAAKWEGQDGQDVTGPGDVHVALEGLPRGRTVAAAALSDAIRGFWMYKSGDRVAFTDDPFAAPLAWRKGSDPSKADLFFPPYRDESGTTMTLRLKLDDGKTVLAQFPGGACDPARKAPGIGPGSATAKPGDDLHDLVNRHGTVRLSRGRYALDRPLVLGRPVRIVGDPGAILAFSQPKDGPAWTSAIKVHHGHTSLEGFAIRFAGPIRWDWSVAHGPAVIGATDSLDKDKGGVKVGLLFKGLDIEGPPGMKPWEEAVHTMRLLSAQSGRIEGNVIRGGVVEVDGGPWAFVGNEHRGTHPDTYTWSVFTGHYTSDLLVEKNKVQSVGPSGKTWRFVVLTNRGHGDVVRDNTVVGVGPRDDDKCPNMNAPEVILTESYRLHFEGRPSGLSAGGRILTIPRPQGDPARTGDVVAALSGPYAGRWLKIAQRIDPNTYLLDSPLPAGDYDIAIATGFVREVIERNVIDSRGGSGAINLCLPGNHFGTRIVGNHLMGAGDAFRLSAYPTESPGPWGWSRVPFFGATIEGNTVEDAFHGGYLGVDRNSGTKTSRGRVYMSATFKNNTAVWSAPFLEGRSRGPSTKPLAAFWIGDSASRDPGDFLLTEEGTRLQAPPDPRTEEALRVGAALINGKPVVDETRPLPADAPAVTTGRRREETRPSTPIR